MCGLICINPVSYTHLDVYKRQATYMASHTPEEAIAADVGTYTEE